MERKKKKLNLEAGAHPDAALSADEHEMMQELFGKKFEYPQHTNWTLKSTSVFGQFVQQTHPDQELGGNDSSQPTNGRGLGAAPFGQSVDTDDPDDPASPGDGISNGKSCHHQLSGQEIGPESRHVAAHACSPQSSLGGSCETSLSEAASKAPRRVSGPKQRGRQRCPLSGVRLTLPSPWQCHNLMSVKEELNTLKDKLSDKEMIAWHQHTNSTNLAGKVVSEIKTGYSAELCTQAWCKFHEILASHDVVPASVLSQPHRAFNSIHLCEAPGAFITSLNHYLVSRGFDTHSQWNWLGTTLNPYYEGNDTGRMISDDRFIRTTFGNWFFGRDDSGDLMSEVNMGALMEQAELMGDIHLVTADGSIDCQENPAEQEVLVSRLHHCEVLASCLLLAPGGTLVIKLFTLLEASSVALLYFLNCVFDKVTVCKPATSKAGNSEVYAVCSGYAAPLSHSVLFSAFSAVCSAKDPHVVLLPREDIPDSFLGEHTECCLYFCRLQSGTIARNLALYGSVTEEDRGRLLHLQGLCAKRYVDLCAVTDIDNSHRIKPFGHKNKFSRFFNSRPNQDWGLSRSSGRWGGGGGHHALEGVGSSSLSLPLGRLHGTFQQRQQQNTFPWQHQLAHVQDYAVEESSGTIKRHYSLEEEEVKGWRVKRGQAFGAVASSHFCDSRMLGDLNLMLQHAQVKLHQQKALAQHSSQGESRDSNFKHVKLHQQKALAQHSSSALTAAFQLLYTTCFFRNNHSHHSHRQRSNKSSNNAISSLYHLPLAGSVTAFWPRGSPEISSFSHRRLGGLGDLRRLGEEEEGGEEGPVGVVVDVTCPQGGEGEVEEVRCQERLLEVVLHVCSYLPSGSTLVLIMPVALTRLTAGLVYIFATLFQETSFCPKEESMFLHQTLCFHNLSYPPYALLSLLETLRHAFAAARPPHPPHTPATQTHTPATQTHTPATQTTVPATQTTTPATPNHPQGNDRDGESTVTVTHPLHDEKKEGGRERAMSGVAVACPNEDRKAGDRERVTSPGDRNAEDRERAMSLDSFTEPDASRPTSGLLTACDVAEPTARVDESAEEGRRGKAFVRVGDSASTPSGGLEIISGGGDVSCAPSGDDPDSDRHMSHDGDSATSCRGGVRNGSTDDSERKTSHAFDERSVGNGATKDGERKMSPKFDVRSWSSCDHGKSGPGGEDRNCSVEISQFASAARPSELNVIFSNAKGTSQFASAARTSELDVIFSNAKGTSPFASAARTSELDVIFSNAKVTPKNPPADFAFSFQAVPSSSSSSCASNSMHPKRSRRSGEGSLDPVTQPPQSSSSDCPNERQRQSCGGWAGDATTTKSPQGSQRRSSLEESSVPDERVESSATPHSSGSTGESLPRRPTSSQVPLEIVPVLEVINDGTFTKFLQASNRQSVTSFLAAMKAAEVQLLSSQQDGTS